MRLFLFRALVGGLVSSACSVKDPLYCRTSMDCGDPARPVCDVRGEFAESDHIANTCISTPANCPVDVCGCAPGTFLSCVADFARVCAADGMSAMNVACDHGCSVAAAGCGCAPGSSTCANGMSSTCGADGVIGPASACALGCAADGRCAVVHASNGLDAAFDEPGTRMDFSLADGAIFDTTTGQVSGITSGQNSMPSLLVVQPNGAPPIRAFLVNSITLGDATIKGSNAFAIAAAQTINISGLINASATPTSSGPGATAGTACAGVGLTTSYDSSFGEWGVGAGGAGFGTAGGAGGAYSVSKPGAPAGVSVGDPANVPLAGGCDGGAITFHTGALGYAGGHGGGAVQLVAGSAIHVVRAGTKSGAISVGGSGGRGTGAGGGSGGSIIVESPSVIVDGPGGGLFANGGAGGACAAAGADATATTQAATGMSCSCNGGGGDGGTGQLAATSGLTFVNPAPPITCLLYYRLGGGGGAVGRVRINTLTGTFAATGGATISASSSVGTLGTR